ncbi:MAG: hypothetical protein EBV06_13295 [Planctomycetia bacterium]|nr:hypothetical protein [Planctomycetia bacterium]
MTCATVRERLLQSEYPDRPGSELSAHLADCHPCQIWLRRLVRLERRIANRTIAVPRIPTELFGELEPARPLVRPFASAHHRRVEGARRKAALASSLAAALLLFAAGLWSWPHLEHDISHSSLAAYQMKRDFRLAKADTLPRRVTALVELAGDFLSEAKQTPENAERLADFVERVFCVDLPELTTPLAAHDRPALCAVLEPLSRLESDAARLAAESRSLRLAHAYQRMAGSARLADQRLRILLRG